MSGYEARPDELKIPDHVAIIMDGNGRWAAARGLTKISGHKEGVKSAREIVRVSGELGVKHLTLYTFSTENFRRSRVEVDALMTLLVTTIGKEVRNLHENNVRLSVIGRLDQITAATRRALESAIEKLSGNSGLHLILAIAYGSRAEIVEAVNRLIMQGKKTVTEAEFAAALDTAGTPDPDLIIRTSGEQRLSNFLLWQAAYSELVISPVLWPEFRRDQYIEAIREYSKRERRYGARKS